MAKDDRKIISGIFGDEGKFVEDQEDELAAAMTQEQLDRLKEAGAIEGKWTSTKKAEPVAKLPIRPDK